MDTIYTALSWGSPLGIGLWFLFTGTGTGIFLWGLSCLKQKKAPDSPSDSKR